MQGIKTYFFRLYKLRYFIIHLVKIDLKNKFRRSKLGLIWTFLSPLLLTLIMASVFSVAFHSDIATYAPYILTGILFWDVVSSAFQAGGYSIIGNDCFIRQCDHPITMYTLKSAIVYIITFCIAIISLLCWLVFVNPMGILTGMLWLLPAVVIYFLIAWAGTTIAGYTCAKYRDYPMMVPLIMQVFWYLSPVFFQEEQFQSNEVLYAWFNINPITHLLNLIRKPFLNCACPSGEDFLISLAFAALLVFFAVRVNRKVGRSVIFYL